MNLGCLVLQALLEHWPPTFVSSGKRSFPSVYVLISSVLVFTGFCVIKDIIGLYCSSAGMACNCFCGTTTTPLILWPLFQDSLGKPVLER